MKLKLIELVSLIVFYLISANLSAQDEYRGEIGISGGGSYYLGDDNSRLFNNMQVAYSGFFRYRFDQRFAARVELTSATVAGKNFPTNHVYATDLCGEFNFFDLEKNEYKQFSKTLSPFIFAGVGMMNYSYINSTSLNASIPFGVGMKVILGKRWNLSMQWTTRLLLADNLEGKELLNNSKSLNGNNFLNDDLLSTFTIGISYDIWKKSCNCVNSSINKEKHKYKKAIN